MRPIEEPELLIAELNRDLDAEGDRARVRYMTTGPSWYDDDEWRVLAFWELPEPQGSVWPSHVLRKYRQRIQDLFEGKSLTVVSYFRTREELEAGDHHIGSPVPEPA